MTRRIASAAALGATVVVTGALLAQPTATSALPADRAERAKAVVNASTARRAGQALASIVGTTSTTASVTVAVCRYCRASQALVRVLARRHARGDRLPSMLLVADARWPTLDTLRARTGSRIILVADLLARVGATPVAWRADTTLPTVGLPAVLEQLTVGTLSTGTPR